VVLKLAPIVSADKALPALFPGTNYKVGVGLHDSSAALIPYLVNFNEPFILISTGTWCISLNPFNQSTLTTEQLKKDCLCYIQFQGKPVKASRLFSGFAHEQQSDRIAEHFHEDAIKYRNVIFDQEIISHLKLNFSQSLNFEERDLSDFKTDIEAYHQLMLDLIRLQLASTQMVLQDTEVKRIFVDGGFSKNSIFMHLLAVAFPYLEIFAASMAQASAVGAALTMHKVWNTKKIPNDIIQLKYYSASQALSI